MRRTMLGLGLAAILITSGCARPLEFHSVSGRLVNHMGIMHLNLINQDVPYGEAVPRAQLEFVPDDPDGLPATAMTDVHGRFTLQTPGSPGQVEGHGRGALEGTYRVVVTPKPGTMKKPIPAEYLQLETTPLTAEVPAGGVEHLQLVLGRTEERKAD